MEEILPVETEEQLGEPSPSHQQASVIRRVFRNRFEQWRAGWRILLYLAIVFLGSLMVSALARSLMPGPDGDMASWVYSLTMTVFDLMFIGAAIVVLRRFDRRPASLLGMGFGRGWMRELAIGIVAGVVSTGGLTLVLVLSGMVSLELSPRVAEAMAVMPRYLVLFTVAAAAEELIFRGYMLQALAEGSRRWLAAVLLSLGFAVVHLGNPDITVVGIANIFLVGLVIAILYFQTLRLWLPIGYHLAWNWAHGWLWGFDVSGIELENQLLIATPNGPDLLTGGEFGLEGSLLTTALIVAVAAWLLTRKVLTPTREMVVMWAPYPRGFGLPPVAQPESGVSDETPAEGATAPAVEGETRR